MLKGVALPNVPAAGRKRRGIEPQRCDVRGVVVRVAGHIRSLSGGITADVRVVELRIGVKGLPVREW